MFAAFRFFTIAALLLASSCCCASATTLTQQDFNNICLLTSNGEMISTGVSCNQYYTCQNGVALLQTCPQGFAFSKDNQSCLPAASVKCGQTGVNPCNADNVGQWAQVAGSCSGYYYCGANGGQRGNCPQGENFNPTTQTCEYASNYPCGIIETPSTSDSLDSGEVDGSAGVNLCTFMPNGVYFGSASSCSAWAVCQNNAMLTGNCPDKYYFNPSIGKCDFEQNVKCVQVSNDPNLTDSPNIGGPCTTQGTMKGATQCNAFYVCNGVNYVLNYCSTGYFFDTVSKTCVPRLNARNNCDRCIGSKLSFVNAYSGTSCSGYLYCQNGIEKSSGNCATGSYFDENAGACVVGVEPEYGCCNPAYYTPANPPAGGPPGPATTSSSTSTSTTTTTTTTTPKPAPAAAAPAPAPAPTN